MIKAVFFDACNTLFYYNFEFLQDLLKQKHSVDVTVEELEVAYKIIIKAKKKSMKCGILLSDDVYESWFKTLGVSNKKIKDILITIKNHPFKHLFWSKVENDVNDILNWFHDRGYKTGLISDSEGLLQRIVEHFGLDSYFDVVVDSDKKVFDRALEKLKIKPSEAVHIGDIYETDILGARSAGIKAVLFDPDGCYPETTCVKVQKVTDLKKLSIFEKK